MAPAEFLTRLARVAEQAVDLGRAEIARVDFDQRSAVGVDARFVDPLLAPFEIDADPAKRLLDEAADAVGLAGRQDVVVGLALP